jgi:hypothetical protein
MNLNTHLPTIIVDLDGTLSDPSHRQYLIEGDSPQWDAYFLQCGGDPIFMTVATVVKMMREHGYRIVLFSGRGAVATDETKHWLKRHGIPYDLLMLRPRGDFRSDTELKKEWLDTPELIDPSMVQLVLEDRDGPVRMYREAGLVCWQVFYGDF